MQFRPLYSKYVFVFGFEILSFNKILLLKQKPGFAITSQTVDWATTPMRKTVLLRCATMHCSLPAAIRGAFLWPMSAMAWIHVATHLMNGSARRRAATMIPSLAATRPSACR